MKKTWSRVLATVLVLAMVLCMPGFAASVADTTDFESDRATSADELTDADLPELLSSDGNHYPIVLVHGLFGWGGTEVLGLNYWGGFSSLRDILNNAGYKVYTPSIGPVASNWDRACELYASSAARWTTAHITLPPMAMPATAARSRAFCRS
jgi:triacylglycerol lipase